MPTNPEDSRLTRIRALTSALDDAVGIPGTGLRFGLDPIIGLVPGLGDVVSAAMSGYIVLTGMQLGAPRSVVTRMIANIAIDTAVGSVPLVGDLFDAGWKSNRKNLSLIEHHVGSEVTPTRPTNRLVVAAAIFALILIAGAGVALTVFVVRFLIDLVMAI